MKRIIQFEIKRGIRSRTFLISLFMGLLICISDFVYTYKSRNVHIIKPTVMQTWIGTDYVFVFNTLFYTMLPILAALPYAASYFGDARSGYIKNICVKTDRKKYMLAKCVSVFVTGFTAVTIPVFINLLLVMRFFPLRIPEKLEFCGASVEGYLFADICNTNTLLYALIFIIVDGVFGGIISVLCVCVSDYAESAFIVLSTPFVAYVITGYLFGGAGRKNLSMLYMINPNQVAVAEEWIFVSIFVGLVLFEVIFLYFKTRRKDIL